MACWVLDLFASDLWLPQRAEHHVGVRYLLAVGPLALQAAQGLLRVPGWYTSWPSLSQSIRTAPKASSCPAMELFPLPLPPVRPMTYGSGARWEAS
ncbi:hypothetical protein EYF80_007233 [Liparis tanakae]|uniref:Uncharacterized protein n=1 Tax=Liparis tanakae TaxID=230148 RepID=A0A4Z2IY34_9TELE|nr:hypothetical protein EYF80_007233 [Liparis tanakae]